MIELTPVAASKLRDLVESGPAARFVRLYVEGRTCCGLNYGLALDEQARDDDEVTKVAGVPLAVDPLSRQYCEGAIIDWVDEVLGGGFVVRNPTAVGGSCSCGH